MLFFFNAFLGADLKRILCNSGSVEKLYPLEKEENRISSWYFCVGHGPCRCPCAGSPRPGRGPYLFLVLVSSPFLPREDTASRHPKNGADPAAIERDSVLSFPRGHEVVIKDTFY